jgi:hypothetical protein
MNTGALAIPPPVLSIYGGSISMQKPLDIVSSFHSERTDSCQSTSLVCESSISNNEVCNDLNSCRFLPDKSTMRRALLTIEISCSDFSSSGKVIENIRLCPLPDCSVYGDQFFWNKESAACCRCNLGICSCREYSCANSISLFSHGPWPGCSERCNESKTVLDQYDVTNIICPDIDSCSTPSLYYQVVLAAFVDKGCDQYLTVAQVRLEVEYYFKQTYGAGAELPYFAGIDVREGSKVYGMPNPIIFRIRLKRGITIRTDGIISVSGFQNSSQDASQIQLETMTCNQVFSRCIVSEDQYFPQIAAFNPLTASVIVGSPRQLLSDRIIHLRMTLRNPSKGQPEIKPSVAVGSQDGLWYISAASAFQSIFSSNEKPKCHGEFIQSYDAGKQSNVFHIQFVCNFPIAINSEIELGGLPSLQSTSSVVPVQWVEYPFIRTGSWNPLTSILKISVNRPHAVNEPICAKFYLGNINLDPVFLNRLTNIQSSIFTPISDRSSPSSVPSIIAKACDFSLSARTFLETAYVQAFITEQHQRSSEENELTCQVIVGIDLIAGDQLMLHGLSNSNQPASKNMLVKTSQGLLSGTWDNIYGSLFFFLVSGIPAGTSFHFRFTVSNPDVPSDPKRIYLSVSTTRGILLPFKFCFGSVLALNSKPVAFLIASIQESSQVQVDLNKLTLQFTLDGTVPPNSVLLVSGLNGTLTGNGQIAVESRNVMGQKGQFNSGVLTIQTAQEISSGTAVIFSIDIVNPAVHSKQLRSILFLFPNITARGLEINSDILQAEEKAAFLDANTTESNGVPGVPNTITLFAICNVKLFSGSVIRIQGLTGTAGNSSLLDVHGLAMFSIGKFDSVDGTLSVPTNQDIERFQAITFSFTLRNPPVKKEQAFPSISALAVSSLGSSLAIEPYVMTRGILGARETASFLNVRISESSKKLGKENTIEIRFQTNFVLDSAVQITISNLVGTQTPSGQDLQLRSNVPVIQKSWNNSGELVFAIMDSIRPLDDVSIRFTIVNSDFARNPVIPLISSDISREALAITPENYSWFQGLRLWSGDQDPRQGKGLILGPDDATIWNLAVIGESNRVAGQPNTLSVTLAPSIMLDTLSKVTISGLTGSLSEATTVELKGFRSVKFGFWVRSTGTLWFSLDEALNTSEPLRFHFTIVNPAFVQPEVLPYVSVQSPNGSTFGSLPFRLHFDESKPACCLSSQEEMRFLQCTVRETSNVANQPNILNFSFLSNVDLPIGTQLTISGLDGVQTPTNANIPVNVAQHNASWTKETGVLIISTSPVIYNCKDGCGRLVEFSVCLLNPISVAATSASLFVAASLSGGYRAAIASTPIIGSVLRSEGQARLFSSVNESTNKTDTMNTITVVLKSNIQMRVCSPRWLRGSATWVDDISGAEQICPWRNGVKCLPVSNLFDGLLSEGRGIEIALTGTRQISFNLKQMFRVDGFQVYVNPGPARAQRLIFQYIPTFNSSGWQYAGALNILQGGVMSFLDLKKSFASQHWRIILAETSDTSGQYPFSSIQELQVLMLPF